MRKIIFTFIILFCLVFLGAGLHAQRPMRAGNSTQDKYPGKAQFSSFTYHGKDKIYDENPLDGKSFYNPILQGFYPDPSITRKGGDYYMVTSTFSYFPGVPIFHSTDLVNWKQLGHILDRPSQLPLDNGIGLSEGIFAPAIRYNPYNDTFYMITTLVGKNGSNFIVKAKDPAGDWSDPIRLPEIGGIDPSLFFDEDGRTYIVHNDGPDGEPLYDGHRAVRIWEYDTGTDKVIGGGKMIINGGVNLAEKPIWIEAPHIYKRHGNYYLMCAEGGTSVWHSEVIFRSEDVWGPYIPAEKNPILTQRHIREPRPYEVTSAGHADITSTPDGKDYGVFLAVRPYEGNKYNTGRETFILPVDWSGEFPVFKGGLEPIPLTLPLPEGVENKTGKDGFLPNGNFTYKDDFDTGELGMKWVTLRTPYDKFHSFDEGNLILEPRPVNVKERKNPSFVGYRQQHLAFSAETALKFTPSSENDLAGIVCLQNDGFNFVLGITLMDGQKSIILEKTEKGVSEIIASVPIASNREVILKVDGDGKYYSFGFSENGKDFTWLAEETDASILSTEVAGGFTGATIGLYATSKK